MVALSSIDKNNSGKILRYKNSIDLSIAESQEPCVQAMQPYETVTQTGKKIIKKLRRPQKWLNDEEVEQMLHAYGQGQKVCELAEQFNCHRCTVNSVLRKHGIASRRSRPVN